MIIKDFYCEACGNVKKDVEVKSCDVVHTRLHCGYCGIDMEFGAVCNGGMARIFRCNDYSQSYVDSMAQNDVKFTGAWATENKTVGGDPVKGRDGKPIHDAEKYRSEDIRSENREKQWFKIRKKRGQQKIFNGATSASRSM